ncbi:PIN domain-containing protein [Phenylobacterium sp.]|uniref:type II toxin-antitoxin system VapC family toxin n=1 Tax=Phenylobacterium sp. TaxID=1871053 RepID=UPI0025EF0147|nr:PIN domain-containing protein [Phenylobacterium sp.]
MILVDTSVWVEHLRRGEPDLARRLDAGEALSHPLVIGELAIGNLHPRDAVLHALRRLPRAVLATDDEVLALIERERLYGLGVGYVDAHLLASTRLSPGATLWTRDRRLAEVANRLGVAAASG